MGLHISAFSCALPLFLLFLSTSQPPSRSSDFSFSTAHLASSFSHDKRAIKAANERAFLKRERGKEGETHAGPHSFERTTFENEKVQRTNCPAAQKEEEEGVANAGAVELCDCLLIKQS